MQTQTSRLIVEQHQGFNGENHWFLMRFGDRWAYYERTPIGLIEAGTDPCGTYWAGREDATRCIEPMVDDFVSLTGALTALAAELDHQWQPPIAALAELMGDD